MESNSQGMILGKKGIQICTSEVDPSQGWAVNEH